MSVADQIMGGATKIQKDGWVTGEMGRGDGPACLLGSVQGTYEVTPAVEAIFRCIIEECDHCRKEFQIWSGINELIDPVGIVWRHNDDCLQSPEDAILLLKKAAHSVE